MNNNTVLLVARILLAAIFIIAGFFKLSGGPEGIAGLAGYIGSKGIPFALPVAWLTATFEVVAGIMIVIGFKTRLVSYALAAFCIAAAVIFHNNFGDQTDYNMFIKNFAIAGGYLALSVVGAGAFSVDAKRS